MGTTTRGKCVRTVVRGGSAGVGGPAVGDDLAPSTLYKGGVLVFLHRGRIHLWLVLEIYMWVGSHEKQSSGSSSHVGNVPSFLCSIGWLPSESRYKIT